MPYPFTELGNAAVKEYQTVISGTADKKYSYNSMEGFLNAKLVVRALQKTPAPITRAKLISTLEGFTSEDLGGYAITYSKQSNLGLAFRESDDDPRRRHLRRVKDGSRQAAGGGVFGS